ncbi:hypothetical protein EV426DRAFT_675660 [Tirmania nivea]|nr:hypothetical protein EV426DRAFT_675660 [Tirmania nivea]
MRRKYPDTPSQTLFDSITQSLDRIEALIKGRFNAVDSVKSTLEGTECHCPPCLSGMTHTELFQQSYAEEELFHDEQSREKQLDATDPKMQKVLHKSGFTLSHLMGILPPMWVPVKSTLPLQSTLFHDINHEILAYHPTRSAGEGFGTSCLLRIKPSKEQDKFNLTENFNPYEGSIWKWHYVYDCGETQRLYFLGEDLMEAIAAVQVLQLGKGRGGTRKVVAGHADWVEVYCRGPEAVLEGVRFWEEKVVGRGFRGWLEGYNCGWYDAIGEKEDDGDGDVDCGKEKEIVQKSAEAKQKQMKEPTQQTHQTSSLSPQGPTAVCSITANDPYFPLLEQEPSHNYPGLSPILGYDFKVQFDHRDGGPYSHRPTNFEQACNTTYSSIGNQLYPYAGARYGADHEAGNCSCGCQTAEFEHGFEQGRQYGINDGLVEGFDEGYCLGYEQGQERGYNMGKNDGYQEGYKKGKEDGNKARFEWFAIENLKTSNPWITAKPTNPSLKRSGKTECVHGEDWRLCKECASFFPDKFQVPIVSCQDPEPADAQTGGSEGLGNLFGFNSNLPIGTKRCPPKSPQFRSEGTVYTRRTHSYQHISSPPSRLGGPEYKNILEIASLQLQSAHSKIHPNISNKKIITYRIASRAGRRFHLSDMQIGFLNFEKRAVARAWLRTGYGRNSSVKFGIKLAY